ncbi:MAG: SDR family oxidoreductase [Bacteroidetes bacterium]|nr:MAG: SDR family oxidoreductase [Bacteroidota bacterium]
MKDKVVVITGGSSGIGKALALKFGSEGSKLVITGRNMEKLLETEAELKSKNMSVVALVADASSEIDSSIMVNRAIKEYGSLDILICNAGISMRSLFIDVDLDVIRKLMDINFWGTVYACKYALPYILKSKGSIVGISSIAGYRGLPARTGYSASKFAMHGFFESLRTEVLKKGVHILLACPGFTASNIRNTALTADGSAQGESPLEEQKIMSAKEVADIIYMGVQKRKRDLVMTSQGKLTVFLNKFAGGFMDKMVYNHFAKEKDSPL